MRRRTIPQVMVAVLIVALAGVATTTVASAARPDNDNFADASIITSLPFDVSGDLREATLEVNEPSDCGWAEHSVWYRYVPTSTEILWVRAGDVAGVYRGDSLDSLQLIGCIQYEGRHVEVEAGTYYFRLVTWEWGELHVARSLPPGNDNFADATVVVSLPFSDNQAAAAATVETGEPGPSCFGLDRTVWYQYTPDAAGGVALRATGYPWGSTSVALYTGASLKFLTEVGCYPGWQAGVFSAEAGVTYYFQVNANNIDTVLGFELFVPPPLQASISFYPGDPSIFDEVSLYGDVYDPIDIGVASREWDLGDGTTASGYDVHHRYAADGDYTVTLTATSFDGRTVVATRVVPVRTHDIAIVKFAVPKSASAGQTRGVTVGVRSNRYAETVEVTLYKSRTPPDPWSGPWVEIGRSTQHVVARATNRGTEFAFNYTFTNDDAAARTVTFRAIARIVEARDAIPGDNEAISLPTKVAPRR